MTPLDIGAPFEPLAESAPAAWEAAPRLCQGDPSSFDSCRWYHQVWQYLRLLNVIASIRVNTDFLVETFGNLARGGLHRDVLVSGTADYAMLAHLHHAYGNRPLNAHVLDLCETPLLLNRWYADRCGLSITTTRTDVLEYTANRSFDVICTHNLLGHFDPDARRRVIARWHSLLRPRGMLVTTQRVEPSLPPESAQEADERARRLRQNVKTAVAARSWSGPDVDAVADAAYEGWRRRAVRHRIRSTQELTAALEAEGFEILSADEGGATERASDRGTPAYSCASFRTRLTARRR